MINIGKKQFLKIVGIDNSGYYLECEEKYEVFMPGTLAKNEFKLGDSIEVFIYTDKLGDQLATSYLPDHEVDDFAFLNVKLVTPHGAFLDMGIPKDILVPRKLQKYKMAEDETHLVKILLDPDTNRIFATSKISQFTNKSTDSYKEKQAIKIKPYHRTPLGFNVLVENKDLGIIYHNEIFENVVIGKEYNGSVKAVRPDGQIDALIREVGLTGIGKNSDIILEALKNSADGTLFLCDKSPAEEIEINLKMSKSAFKKALGILYKSRKVKLCNGYIKIA